MFIITPLPFYFISFQGDQARAFLQGQVTCDVMDVTPTHNSLGCYANPKGRVEAIFHLFEHAEILYMAIPYNACVAEQAQNSLKKVAAFSKVKVETSGELKALGVDELSPEGIKSAQHIGCTILQLPDSDRKILVGSEHMIATWKNTLKEYKEDFIEQWIIADFQTRLPHITAETIGVFLPHHLNLLSLGALNFKKGCYRGQEIIARMHYKSSIKKHLELLSYPSSQTLYPGLSIPADSIDTQHIEIVNILKQNHLQTTLALGIVPNNIS